MPGSPSWMPYAPRGVKGFDDDDDDDDDDLVKMSSLILIPRFHYSVQKCRNCTERVLV